MNLMVVLLLLEKLLFFVLRKIYINLFKDFKGSVYLSSQFLSPCIKNIVVRECLFGQHYYLMYL